MSCNCQKPKQQGMQHPMNNQPMVQGMQHPMNNQPMVQGMQHPKNNQPMVQGMQHPMNNQQMVQGMQHPMNNQPMVQGMQHSMNNQPMVQGMQHPMNNQPMVQGMQHPMNNQPMEEHHPELGHVEGHGYTPMPNSMHQPYGQQGQFQTPLDNHHMPMQNEGVYSQYSQPGMHEQAQYPGVMQPQPSYNQEMPANNNYMMNGHGPSAPQMGYIPEEHDDDFD
ncbi:hypothetical protein CR203_10560 [Salipaludibacillus neizhouensis]|uniref:Uncharacterized protein n=1 Tax=Salipaludibacillus neizhouensis TaxID=885475 RepID=A0A3A9KT05_9BACI|nr:hypothetical protein [Salipaludibacillus neizhouensis]RKL67776.1 hypothetical protein CR203_10560 [Salipaludibacillus neizhouensis]